MTLSKRINELGVTEPIIQQQGADRIVVQLPGVQDVARAKDIIGRTATLELRMVDDHRDPGTEADGSDSASTPNCSPKAAAHRSSSRATSS